MPGAIEKHGERVAWPGTKNGQSHRVWLPDLVRKIIPESNDDETSGFVFVGVRGAPLKLPSGAMQAICKRLGIKHPDKVTPHDLRRTFLTKVTQLKFGRDAMDRIANHKEKGRVTDVYDRHGYHDENKILMETVADHIVGLCTGRPRKTSNVVQMKHK
jgi:integrase